MSIYFQPITTEEYPNWFDLSTSNYAEDKIRSKQWGLEGALERARKDTENLLPDGVATPNHHLLHVVDHISEERVGYLWWCLTERFGRRIAFIFDIHIFQNYQRRGFATSTLQHLEKIVREHNVQALSLHVFAFNTGAYKLYEKLGYVTTSVSMTRELDVPQDENKI